MKKTDYDLINIRITQVIIQEFEKSKFNTTNAYINYIIQYIDNGIPTPLITTLYSDILIELNTVFGFTPEYSIKFINKYFKEKYYKKFWDLGVLYNIIEIMNF